MSFRVGDSWCRASHLALRSGVRLGVTTCQFDPAFAFAVDQPPTDLEFVISRGAELRALTPDGRTLLRGGSTLQLGRVGRPLRLQVRSSDETPMESVSLSVNEGRLREILGTDELPRAFRTVIESEESHPLTSQAITPGLFRLLEEVVNADVTGPSRQLWHEAKSLELLALMTDELVETQRASEFRLSTDDIDRLQRVRIRLLERLDAPPTLAELARFAGWNETKLKTGFRILFGAPVFAHLRRARMEEASRLLRAGRLNVTEVAQRVGYANPSKFAAAFRKEFGISPSHL